MRAKRFRYIVVLLACGHSAELNTGRYRVSEAVRVCLVGNSVRTGVWCHKCSANCQPEKFVGMISRD